MKALVLNGISIYEIPLDSICDALVDELECREWHTNTIILRQTDIADCKGCFSCWHCTPGICIIEDYGRELAGKIINSGLFVVVTPVRFGGFSYDAKKAIDRMVPLTLPFFHTINGEAHHKPRYEKYPSFLVVGIMQNRDDEKEKIFMKLVKQNARSFPYPSHACGVVYLNDSISTTHENISILIDSLGEQ